MSLSDNPPPSLKPVFERAAHGTPSTPVQGHSKPAPEAKQSYDMPGPGGHAVRQNYLQQVLSRLNARLAQSMPRAETEVPSRLDNIRKAFYEKAEITQKAPENKVSGQKLQPAKIKEKFNDLSM